ncbi:MAG TPA: insulinase family protein, partial [Thermoguttaceae bacterium]
MKIDRFRRFSGFFIFLLSFFLSATLIKAAEQAEPAESGAKNGPEVLKYTTIQGLPDDVTLATLSNGLTVIVQENHVAPVATVRCFVKNTGSVYEGKNLGAGISHVLEHVVAGGTTTHRTEKEINQIIDSFGGATNAFTSNDMTTFFIDCPAKETMTAIELLADSMQHVNFEPAEFERELKVVRRELADGEVNRQRVLWNMLCQTVYTLHPARHPIIGYLEVLNGTTNQAIMD